MSRCSGRGDCLRQLGEHSYVPMFDCPFKCKPVPCPNSLLCGAIGPQCMYIYGRCTNCDIAFGYPNLTFVDSAECPVCLETKQAVRFPSCGHPVCVQCFRRMWYGPPRVGEPPFPYPELEDAYDDGDDEWLDQQSDEIRKGIEDWNNAWNAWDDAWDDARRAEPFLRKCPVCRHEHTPIWKKAG